jgi:hypothetical protein
MIGDCGEGGLLWLRDWERSLLALLHPGRADSGNWRLRLVQPNGAWRWGNGLNIGWACRHRLADRAGLPLRYC